MSTLDKKVLLKKGRTVQAFDEATARYLAGKGWERILAGAKPEETNSDPKSGQKSSSTKNSAEDK